MFTPLVFILLLPLLHAAPESGESLFSYDPNKPSNPSSWASLSPAFAICSAGLTQSPIDVPTLVRLGNSSTQPYVQPGFGDYTMSNSTANFALSCNTANCGTIFMSGKIYNLINIHYHAPSEHTRDGMYYPLEVHLVHSDPQGQLAVVSILFQIGAFNQGVDQTMKGIREGTNSTVFTGYFVGKSGYCRYDGSLTTPPCSEGVKWILTERIAQVSEKQLNEYRSYVGVDGNGEGYGNNRPLQKMNLREVTCYMSHFY